MTTHVVGDTALLTGRSLRHITRSLDTIITTTIMPIAFLLLFVFVLGGAIDTGSGSYIDYLLPGILVITVASGVSYTAYRLFLDLQSGIFERFHSMPIARSAVLWAHVLTSLAAIGMSVAVVVLSALVMGFRSGAGVLAWLAVTGILALFTLALTWLAVIPGLTAKSVDGASAFSYPLILLPFVSSAFVPTGTMPGPVRAFAENQPVTAIVDAIRNLLAGQPVGTEIWVALGWCLGLLLVAYGLRHARLPPPGRLKRCGVGQADHMLTIGRLASYAGVTIRAVRHYHKVGLLPEPERDASGYRTYDAAAVVRLIRIRTLAEAGVPLAQVRELLDADPTTFAAATTEIDRHLRAQIRALQEHRRRIAQLGSGASLAITPEVADYLDRLRAIGAPEELVERERDAWILMAARWPEALSALIADKVGQLENPNVVRLYQLIARVVDDWDDEELLQETADVIHELLVQASATGQLDWQGEDDPAFIGLMDSFADAAHPAVARLRELVGQRGWTGWTQVGKRAQ